MKIEKQFTPVVMTITLETQEEYDKFMQNLNKIKVDAVIDNMVEDLKEGKLDKEIQEFAEENKTMDDLNKELNSDEKDQPKKKVTLKDRILNTLRDTEGLTTREIFDDLKKAECFADVKSSVTYSGVGCSVWELHRDKMIVRERVRDNAKARWVNIYRIAEGE